MKLVTLKVKNNLQNEKITLRIAIFNLFYSVFSEGFNIFFRK